MSDLIELYEFRCGSVTTRYVQRGEDRLLLGHVWHSTPLSRSKIANSTEAARNDLEIAFPLEHPFARQYMGYGPEQTTSLTIRRNRLHTPDQFYVFWVGRFADCDADETEISMVFQTLINAASDSAGVICAQKFCPHVVYHRGCNLQRANFANVTTVDAIDPRMVVLNCPEAAAQLDGYYRGGMVQLPNNSLRYITDHIGSAITLWRPAPEVAAVIEAGQTLTLYPGCDGSLQTCNERFNNLDNNTACYWIPDKNPYGGSNVF